MQDVRQDPFDLHRAQFRKGKIERPAPLEQWVWGDEEIAHRFIIPIPRKAGVGDEPGEPGDLFALVRLQQLATLEGRETHDLAEEIVS